MAYLPLSTANLPDPVIDPAQGASPEDYFNTVIYTGNSLNPASVTGVGFQPDFVWAKTRSFGNTNHRLQDAVRGSNKRLMSDLTSAEIDTAGGIQSFDADGFTVGDGTSKDGFIHFGGRTFVAWNWKANGSGVSNTDGSIPSTVSANTTSGFSIVSYTGTGANATVGHGLGVTPDLLIIKNRGNTRNWAVWHSALGGDNLVTLNTTGAVLNNSVYWGGGNHTSTTFEVNTSTLNNENTYNHIAYCFHSVEGFSKFGSYVGNGSADGAFVYTGFRPSFLIIKATGLSEGWIMYDVKRNSYNLSSTVITAEEASGDATNNVYGIDILSNGFKCRYNWNGVNGSGQNYIYMAFAENPFKYSNAR